MPRRLNPRYQELHNPSKSSNHKQEVKSRCRNIQLGGYAIVCNENNMKQSNNLHITHQMLQCQEPIWSPFKRWTCPSVKDPNRVAMLQWKMLSIPAMSQCKVVYPSQQINQPLLLVPKRKHLNVIHRNQNPRAPWMWIWWLCPSINQLKWLCSNEQSESITNERVTPQINCHLKNQPSMSRVCPNAEYRVEWLYLQ